MSMERKFIQALHNSTKRNFIERMMNEKVQCMNEARKFDKSFWDGDRKFGYGGYKYIKDRWKPFAENLIATYSLNENSKVLDVGCGKGFVLYELKKIIPNITIIGFDISSYAIDNSNENVKDNLFVHDAGNKYPFEKNEFDLVFSLATLHNLKINKLFTSLNEINRVSKSSYLMVESYRNNEELFNLQCWALTAECFFDKDEWIWIFKKSGYSGDYEFIYF